MLYKLLIRRYLRLSVKILWLLIGIAIAVFLPVLSAHAQTPQPLQLDRAVTPKQGVIDEVELEVTLTLTGDSKQCQTQIVGRPADIILVIDHSSSMYEQAGDVPGTKMDALKSAAKQFITKANLNREQIGVVEFDQGADVVQALTNNRGILLGAIDAIQAGGGTAIEQGIIMAQRELATARARTDASHIMIVMTDGRNSNVFGFITGALELAAKDAKALGIRIITIGLGQDVDQDVLESIASQPSDFYAAPQASDLDRIYTTIGTTIIQPLAATDVTVTHVFDASALEIIPNSIQPPGVVNGDKIRWTLKEVLDTPTKLTYRARPRATGNFNLDRGDKVSFKHCGNEAQTLDQPTGLPVAIQAPPTHTPTPSSTPTLTPRPTNTPRPTPLPTPIPPITQQVGDTMFNLFCDSLLPLLLLALLLLIFFIWWFRQILKERAKQFQEPPEVPDYCRWIPWLLLPLFLILLWFIWNAFSASACISRDALYFWRIGEGGGNGRIFVTNREGTKPAQEFTSVNNGQCTGCHSVSSESHRIAAVSGGASGNIVVYSLDGKKIDIPQIQGSYTAWSPDGTQLAVSTTDSDIVIVDIPTKTITKLDGASSPNEFEQMPSWSPDGQTIAFVRGQRPSNSWTFDGPTDIYTVPATGGNAIALAGASGDGFNYYPAFSPDGRWLAFTHHTRGSTTYAAPQAEIYLVPAKGGKALRLAANDAADGTPLENVSNSWPSWSRTGEFLAFNSKRNDPSYDIFITRVDQNGNSGPAEPVASASIKGIFEHLPFQGEPPHIDPLPALLALWPCLIPFLLVLLAWWLCRRLHKEPPPPLPPKEEIRFEPGILQATPLEPFWQVAPTLIVGVGGTGRWVLTHLKKALRDGGAGELPDKVRFALLDTAEHEETNVFYDAQGKLVGVEFAGESLKPNEILLMNQSLASVIRQGASAKDAALAGWFPYAEYRSLTEQAQNLGYGTGGRRPMARAGLID
ncbi:VWA domain-containing protein, partial [Anaerolineae bacterium CFX7]|nr:VWA domain-containing protein [Anaerolineae bacterium CFX7]